MLTSFRETLWKVNGSQRHRIVEVLPDDSPDTVATWLQAPPTIQVVTRDGDQVFAKGIATGAPDAQQVADRLHRLQNLRQGRTRTIDKLCRHLEKLGRSFNVDVPK
ncbi:MAG: transposase [Clostridia bacterium]